MGATEGDGRVLAYRPNELIELQFDLGRMKPHVYHLFDADGDSTRFTRRVEVDPQVFLKVMQPIMKSMFRKQNVDYLATLKRLIESS